MKKFLFVIALLALFPATAAKAHDPIILTSEQSTPIDGPLLVDGTISFALYGSLEMSDDTRGFRVKFNEGDPLYISLLIPDLAPENAIKDTELPYLEVVDPSGTKTKLATTERIAFPEPFTGTNYIRLVEQADVATMGIYSITITGKSPARFTVSVGKKEQFGTAVENITNRALGVAGVMAWYETASTTQTTVTDETSGSEQSSGISENSLSSENDYPNTAIIVIVGIVVLSGAALILKNRKKKTRA